MPAGGLTTRSQNLANNQVSRCITYARDAARRNVIPAGDTCCNTSCRLSRQQCGVTAETVNKLCDQGHVLEAVEAVGVMVQQNSAVPKSLMYTILKKCAVAKDIVLGRRIHAVTVKKGYESDTFLCNHILRMYASHGRLQEAMDVFTLTQPDVFMWSSIISAHVKHGNDGQAIQLYQQMCRSSVKPDDHVFVAALQACARGSDLTAGQQVHADVLASGVQPNLFVCNGLVDMYAKCGSLEDARRVFDGLHQKDVVTWTALMAGYSQRGMGQEALRLHSAMEEEGLAVPNSVTFLCLLQACAIVGTAALRKGEQLHAEIRERGYEADVFIASSLVNMYAKCGSLEDAQTVFDGLAQKDVVTWTALIAGYTQQGLGQEALRLYTAMQKEGIAVPNCVTWMCLLQACASVGVTALEIGKKLHAQIREQEHQADLVVANNIINMYAKCGSLEDAQRVFDGLGQKDVVTWTALIAGYSHQGMGQEALRLYSAMQEEGTAVPNSVTFACLLQACASVGFLALDKGKQLHTEIREQGLQDDVHIASSLVNMYAKSSSLEDAQTVFDGLGQKEVATWTALIAGYCHRGRAQEALHLYRNMREEGLAVPDSMTLVSLLRACASVGALALETGKQLHAQITEQGLQVDVFMGNTLVNMYAKCGSLAEAQSVFDGLDQKDVVTWTALIAGYSQQGMGQEALRLYSVMQESGMDVPDSVTFVCLLQACAGVGTPTLEKGKQLHEQAREQGYEMDVFVASSLVSMYAKCGSLEDAQKVFDGLARKDVVMWNAMIAGYSQQGMGEEALSLYRAMQQDSEIVPDCVTFACLLQACANLGTVALEKGKQLHAEIRERGYQGDTFVISSLINMYAKCGSVEDAQRVFDGLGPKSVVTWNALISAYSQQGMGHEALRLYRTMQEEGRAAPSSVTFVCLLQACANVAALHLGRQLHAQIEEQGLQSDLLVAGSLINMYGKSGSMVDAQQVFDSLSERDVAVWSALIAGYSCQGNSEAVFDLVEKMGEDGIQPAAITLLSVLKVCSHSGLVNKGRDYFEGMSRRYSITPTVEHYACMVDLLGRAGRLDEALALVRAMPVQPNADVWHTLLGACQKWSNVKVGSHAFSEAVNVDEKHAAPYVLMSNIFTGAQMWEQAQEIQARRIRMRAWKEPGQTCWTDLDGLVYSFLVSGWQHGVEQGLGRYFPKCRHKSTWSRSRTIE